jgi:carboxypeptidase D
MVGMMWENGPFTISDAADGVDYILTKNPFSWNEVADVLYVEQPIRTGFSTAAEGSDVIIFMYFV